MSEHDISSVFPGDRWGMAQIDALLAAEGIRRDGNLDYSCAIFDGDRAIATGSCFGSTLRCLAVDGAHQGEGLMNQIVTHLMEVQLSRGNTHLFLYTKLQTAGSFAGLGFYEIARVAGTLMFMENRRRGFSSYLTALSKAKRPGVSGALVMNANPFTLGHRYLAEKAASACDTLHLFIVSEDISLVPFAVRKRLAALGTAHIPNAVWHDCGPYMISSATFPSYFLRDGEAAIEGQARLDVEIFKRIAAALGVTRRYVGEEPTSLVTGLYNRIMERELPQAGIDCVVAPRLLSAGTPISAGEARRLLQAGDWARLSALLPQTTLDYFRSPEAEPLLRRIRQAGDVLHY